MVDKLDLLAPTLGQIIATGVRVGNGKFPPRECTIRKLATRSISSSLGTTERTLSSKGFAMRFLPQWTGNLPSYHVCN